MATKADNATALARRLRRLRTEEWSQAVTQPVLAKAFGVSVPLISSWESLKKLTIPPPQHLEHYALFFSTTRSMDGGRPRLIDIDDLTESERARREELLRELTALRASATGIVSDNGPGAQTAALNTGPWHFPDGAPVTIICASLPPELRADESYTNPHSPDYIELYNYADLDALVELYGHVRAANPRSQVTFHLAEPDHVIDRDDLTKHLVLLGGVDWNPLTRDMVELLGVPVTQVAREGDRDTGAFAVDEDGRRRVFEPVFKNKGGTVLVEDVAQFVRGPNPHNRKLTVTICNGMYGRGTYAAVRTLTDAVFRDRNAEFIRSRVPDGATYSILARAKVTAGTVVTPDWTEADTRLHEWVGIAT
ncbi:helix-turn-helix domain-containing protein [Phytohabitans sp. LJ34]|uniref:helix-turn-helix domain-containing protein n=1 Tax=Phytohabitans sp. LJ34 TaxID=3452217 RepID=UPI003F889469